uniref:IRG-type G domain-containing protein n=1 Tax=Salvator merianae TaxID=96440 RepID=A0A8D0BEK6_SALMN
LATKCAPAVTGTLDMVDERSVDDLSGELEKKMKTLMNIKIDIAITGVSGAGKSSLINALRGMSDDDEEHSAKTGPIQTTIDPKPYPYPPFPTLILWDLPGIGTPDFKPEKYLEMVKLERYDFFIIVAGERFTVNDTTLAQEIKKMGKKFYYVRTKVDGSLACESKKKKFKEEETLQEIRRYCEESLKEAGEQSPRVFLISRWDTDKYDFPLLVETFEEEQDDIKRDALIMFLPILTKDGLRRKQETMEKYIRGAALVSCGIGCIPLPGLSLACDTAILVSMMTYIHKVFGLDKKSLHILANRFDKPVEDFKSVIENCPTTTEITEQFVKRLLRSSVIGVTTITELALQNVPVLGSLFGGVNSFLTTFYMLKKFLNDVVRDAENVLAKLAGQELQGQNHPGQNRGGTLTGTSETEPWQPQMRTLELE